MIGRAALALATCAACDHSAVSSCGDDLGGVWRGPGGDYQLLEARGRRELYPLHLELPTDLPAGVIAAPAVIDLPARGDGTITRRYERGAQFCRRTGVARLRDCDRRGLTLELAPPPPPTDWQACTGPTAMTHTVQLTR